MLTAEQRLLVDSIIDDCAEVYDAEALRNKLETRIYAHDKEFAERIEMALPAAITRALREVL